MTGEIHIRSGLMIKTGLTEKRFLSGRCCHLFFLLSTFAFLTLTIKIESKLQGLKCLVAGVVGSKTHIGTNN